MASDQRTDHLHPGDGRSSSNLDAMPASSVSHGISRSASSVSTLSAFATGEHNVGASSSQVKMNSLVMIGIVYI